MFLRRKLNESRDDHMENNNATIEQAVELFENFKYREAIAAFAEVYDQSEDENERKTIFDMLDEAFYAPNSDELRANYSKNIEVLKEYPYFFDKTFREYDDLNFQLFPVSDEYFYCYSKKKDCFFGEYDAATRHQMRYFFENLDDPLKVENEDNFYNLNFLNDNVRASEDFAGDNHIYLFYDTPEPLERLMMTCDLEPVLARKKFVFLVGEENKKRYPVDFKKEFGIDYDKTEPKQLKIEEINRIYFNEPYYYSGNDFFNDVMNGADHFLVINGYFFHYESAKEIVDTCLEYIQEPERIINVSQFLGIIQNNIQDIKLTAWPIMVTFLPDILEGKETITVHELFKAIMIAAMQASYRIEGKQYLSRISPIIFFDPHTGGSPQYYELLKHFKYRAIESTMREPTTRFVRAIQVAEYGLGNDPESLRILLRSTYQHAKNVPRWLLDSGFYAAKLEDLKLRSKETLHTICRLFNIPYTDKLLEGKSGLWSVRFTNEKGETLQGFDRRSVRRDISDIVTPKDKKRFDLYYWPIHHHFHYPCANEQDRLTPDEAKELFSEPFRFERIYAKQRASYYKALETAAPKNAQKIQKCIDQKYALDPMVVHDLIQRTMTEDYLNGFDPELVLPTVMLPEDEMDWPLPQAQRLQTKPDKLGYQTDTHSERDPNNGPAKVYWITGLSGAGKTTVGRLWYKKLKEQGEAAVFLDGDELRQVFGDDLGYTEEDRRKSAMRNARLCAMLARQGLTAVCCTISMFDDVRAWNRENIPGYFEVYIKVSMETLRNRDQKGLYSQADRDVAGVHFQVEEPKCPDLILENDGQKTPAEQIAILQAAVTEQGGLRKCN